MAHPSVSLPILGPSDAAVILQEPVYSVVAIGQGIRSRVYRVETEDGATRIVRITAHGTGRIAREAWVRSALRRHPDVPLVAEIAVHHGSLAQAAEVVTMAEVPGVTMFSALRTMFEPEIRALYERFGAGLAAIHRVSVDGFGLIDGSGRGAHKSWREAFEAIANAALEEARVSPLGDLVEQASETVDPLLASLDDVAPSLIHGDAQLMNVQVYRGRIVAFFDFEFASGADPLYELAYLERLFDPSHNPAVAPEDLLARREAFYSGYGRNREPPAPRPDAERLYQLVHALRGTEFLSVVGPQLAAPIRSQSAQLLREGVLRWLKV